MSLNKLEDVIKNKRENIFKLSDICIQHLYPELKNKLQFDSIHILSDNCICILLNESDVLINRIKKIFYDYKTKFINSNPLLSILFICETEEEIEKQQYLINEIIKK